MSLYPLKDILAARRRKPTQGAASKYSLGVPKGEGEKDGGRPAAAATLSGGWGAMAKPSGGGVGGGGERTPASGKHGAKRGRGEGAEPGGAGEGKKQPREKKRKGGAGQAVSAMGVSDILAAAKMQPPAGGGGGGKKKKKSKAQRLSAKGQGGGGGEGGDGGGEEKMKEVKAPPKVEKAPLPKEEGKEPSSSRKKKDREREIKALWMSKHASKESRSGGGYVGGGGGGGGEPSPPPAAAKKQKRAESRKEEADAAGAPPQLTGNQRKRAERRKAEAPKLSYKKQKRADRRAAEAAAAGGGRNEVGKFPFAKAPGGAVEAGGGAGKGGGKQVGAFPHNRSGDPLAGGTDEPGRAAPAPGERKRPPKNVVTPSQASDHPFEVDPTDHCETPFEAYKDIEPLLFQVALSLGKTKETLKIYDPYFCEGSMVAHLNKLGFKHVYNKNEDFYKVIEDGRVPEHDVVVTNPPYSLDHMERILNFVSTNEGRPWLLCLPNFVYRKSYYGPALGIPEGLPTPAYLVPQARYDYYSPGRGKHELFGPKVTSPFDSFWYLYLGKRARKICEWWQEKHGEAKGGPRLSLSEDDLPKSVRTEKRLNPKQRKKMVQKMKQGSWRRMHPDELE